jgi:VWA domain containing CoxE-like protein
MAEPRLAAWWRLTEERSQRWRMALGAPAEESLDNLLSDEQRERDRVLSALYDRQAEGLSRKGGSGESNPSVARWLGDIRRLFPDSVVRVMQRDAVDSLGLERMLLEPEALEAFTPDVQLVANLLQLKDVMPPEAKAAARHVVQRVVDELVARWREPMRQAVHGSLDRARKERRPRHRDIDWNRTILANLGSYSPEHRTVIPERRIGFGRRRSRLDDVILCLDQNGSMAPSIVYGGIFASALAALPSLSTRLVVFDTNVVDLSDELGSDPVDLLFGIQLGGGTDIARAMAYCAQLVSRPERTTLVLVSDLFEGGQRDQLLTRAAALVDAGVSLLVLLALDDEGAPSFDHENAAALAALGVPCFACTPDRFPDLMAAALARRDVGDWAAREGIVTQRG